MSKHRFEWLRAGRLSTTLHGQSGYATVEFALTIPLVVMITAVCGWLLGLTATEVRLHTAAASAARIVARGQELPPDFSRYLPQQAQFEVTKDQAIVRVTIRMNSRSPIPAIPVPIRLSASAVAAREDLPNG
jgi:hypothetical protein